MKLSTKIIGINWQCNSSACLMIDGKIVGSVSEERFTRVKNDERYPLNSINWLLKEFKLRGVPTTVLVNKNGEEFARIIGEVDFEDKKFLKWLLKYD